MSPRHEVTAAALAKLPDAIGKLIPEDLSAFFSVLELGYLAASADGLDDTERDQLAAVLERSTGAKIERAAFDAHFEDLDATVAALGRRERLARAAADFENAAARTAALQFATLVAVGDGKLGDEEIVVLGEIGAIFELPADQIDALIAEAVGGLS